MLKYEGKCPSCGKIHYSSRKGEIVICDCWQHCPLCEAEMSPYAPDLTLNTYGADAKRELAILMVCTHHSPPFFSTKKPVGVVCT
ncbi:MAG: hypothetical protein ACUVQX_00905 [Candidatus Bathycorpusculaceae bacterium]